MSATVVWEKLEVKTDLRFTQMWRAKVPGGWFVKFVAAERGGMFFYPDPNWFWDGGSMK